MHLTHAPVFFTISFFSRAALLAGKMWVCLAEIVAWYWGDWYHLPPKWPLSSVDQMESNITLVKMFNCTFLSWAALSFIKTGTFILSVSKPPLTDPVPPTLTHLIYVCFSLIWQYLWSFGEVICVLTAKTRCVHAKVHVTAELSYAGISPRGYSCFCAGSG